MPSFSHWRLNLRPNLTASNFVLLGEVKLLDASGTDLAVGGTATASSEFSGSFLVGLAFDKNDTTEWSTAGASDPTPWVQYALPSPADVAKLSIRYGASSASIPAYVGLEASNSPSGPWTTLILAGAGPVAATTRIYEFVATQTGIEYSLATSPALFTPPEYLPLTALDYSLRLSSRDFVHGGTGYIFGTTYLDGSPDVPVGNRRVRLHRDVDGMALRETFSNAAGYYEFRDISLDYKYTVIAYDHTHDYRAVAADNLTPEVAP